MAVALRVLQLASIRQLEAGLVLGQDLHERPQLQPPLLSGNPVPANQAGEGVSAMGVAPRRCRRSHGQVGPPRSLPTLMPKGRAFCCLKTLTQVTSEPLTELRQRGRPAQACDSLTRSPSPSSARPQVGRGGSFCICPAHRWSRHLQTSFLEDRDDETECLVGLGGQPMRVGEKAGGGCSLGAAEVGRGRPESPRTSGCGGRQGCAGHPGSALGLRCPQGGRSGVHGAPTPGSGRRAPAECEQGAARLQTLPVAGR